MTNGGTYAASVGIGIAENSAAASAPKATVSVTMPMGSITVAENGGLADASTAYSEVSGMTGLTNSTEDAATEVSISAALGDVSASFSSDLNLDSDNSSFGASGAIGGCLLYTSPSPRDVEESRMPSSA